MDRYEDTVICTLRIDAETAEEAMSRSWDWRKRLLGDVGSGAYAQMGVVGISILPAQLPSRVSPHRRSDDADVGQQ
jgi:hypothetical protein